MTTPNARCATTSDTQDDGGQVRGSVTPRAVIGPVEPKGHAFAFLAPGPFLGAIAMLRLLRSPYAAQIAGGRG